MAQEVWDEGLSPVRQLALTKATRFLLPVTANMTHDDEVVKMPSRQTAELDSLSRQTAVPF